MEYMAISVMSVVEHDGQIHARARATARDARISLEVTFEAGFHTSQEDVWQQERDEVLRYLDVA